MATVGIIGYLFWPREAIELAKKFEAQGTLNKKAIAVYPSNQSNGTLTAGSAGFITQALNEWTKVSNITFNVNNTTPLIVFSEVGDINGSEGGRIDPYVFNKFNLKMNRYKACR